MRLRTPPRRRRSLLRHPLPPSRHRPPLLRDRRQLRTRPAWPRRSADGRGHEPCPQSGRPEGTGPGSRSRHGHSSIVLCPDRNPWVRNPRDEALRNAQEVALRVQLVWCGTSRPAVARKLPRIGRVWSLVMDRAWIRHLADRLPEHLAAPSDTSRPPPCPPSPDHQKPLRRKGSRSSVPSPPNPWIIWPGAVAAAPSASATPSSPAPTAQRRALRASSDGPVLAPHGMWH